MTRGMRHHKLTNATVRRRMLDSTFTMYPTILGAIKGVVIAIAGIALYFLCRVHTCPDRFIRIEFWFTSFVFSCVTLSTWRRGVILTNWHANGWDDILPLWIGISEGLLFLILSPKEFAGFGDWRDWYFIFAVFLISVAFLVLNRLIQARDKEYDLSDETLAEAVLEYRHWMRKDVVGAATLGLISLSSGLLNTFAPNLMVPVRGYVDVALAFGATIIGGFIIYAASSQYRYLSQL